MEDISRQIEALLKRQAKEGPGTLERYKTGLDAANDQDEAGIEKANTLYSDKSKFENSTLGALGVGLMKGGKNGRFGEGLASGLSAAIDTQNENKKANLSREEKLIALDTLRANLTRNKAKDGLDVYNARGSMATGLGGTRNQLSDLRLGQEPIVGEDQTPESSATSVLMDYNRNPQKYAGPEGQALIKNAQEMYKKMMTERGIATRAEGRKAAIQPLTRTEASRVSKRMAELDGSAEDGRAMKNQVSILRNARNKTDKEGMPGFETFSDKMGWLPSGMGGDTATAGQTIKSAAIELQLALTQKTKGAISNAEMSLFGSASPGGSMVDAAAGPVMDAYDAIADRVVERSKFMKSWVQKNGTDYGADEAWDGFVADNPIIVKGEGGGFSVNKSNVSKWQKYLVDINETEPEVGAETEAQEYSDENRAAIDSWIETQRNNGISEEEISENIARRFPGY